MRKNEVTGPLATDPPHFLFKEQWYRDHHPDLADYEDDLWHHFVEYGDAEGRAPGPDFDPEFYRRTYLSLADHTTARAFAHYVTQGRNLGFQTFATDVAIDTSSEAFHAALTGRPYPVVLIGNDAQRAGGPHLLLAVAERLRRRGFDPIFLLRRGGPLLESFRRLGPTMILDEGWNVAAMGSVLPRTTPVLGNTCWSAPVLAELAPQGPRVLLVHEMPAYLREHDLIGTISAATQTVVVATPGVATQLRKELGEHPRVEVARPGLFSSAPSRSERRAVAELLLAEHFAGRTPLFIAAGYADHRKGFDLFLDAARSITRKRPAAGFIWLGECDASALELAAQARVDGVSLLLPGFREDAMAWYDRATVYLLTSRQDPGPTTVADAARLGVPFAGLQTDIGLRDLGSLLDGVGEFLPDVESLVERALAYADDDTPQQRSTRAAHVNHITSFDTYVDEVLTRVRATGPFAEADREPTSVRLLARDTGRWIASTSLDGVEKSKSLATAAGDAWSLSSRRITSKLPTRRRVTVAATIATPPTDALSDPIAVRQLQPPKRSWVSTPQLLPHVPHPSDAHLGRSTESLAPDLVAAVEMAGPLLTGFAQFDIANPPRWAAEGRRPPLINIKTPRSSALRVTALAPVGTHTARRPIGVFVHIFHVDRAELLANRIAMIPQAHHVYISTDTEEKAAWLRELFPKATVRVFENRGRDVYPKLCGFADVYDDHDIVLHLHSKRPLRPGVREGWLEHILGRLLPSPDGTRAIIGALSDVPALGMISPVPFPELKGTRSWGPNLPLAELVTWGHDWPPMPPNGVLAFPVGSMFWARVDALRPLLDLALPLDYFSPEDDRRDGTLAHALERLFGVSCTAAGLKQIFVETPDAPTQPRPRTPEQLARWLGRPPRTSALPWPSTKSP